MGDLWLFAACAQVWRLAYGAFSIISDQLWSSNVVGQWVCGLLPFCILKYFILIFVLYILYI